MMSEIVFFLTSMGNDSQNNPGDRMAAAVLNDCLRLFLNFVFGASMFICILVALVVHLHPWGSMLVALDTLLNQCWMFLARFKIYFDFVFHPHPSFQHPKPQEAPAANS